MFTQITDEKGISGSCTIMSETWHKERKLVDYVCMLTHQMLERTQL